MGDTDKFVLRWNDFEKNIVGAYKDLRTDKDFFDCSLVCGGRTFEAHRVILSASSPVFRQMMRETSHHHPVVYLRGVRSEDLLSLLDFIYHGEASVAEADLDRFVEVAEEFQVRGLQGLFGDGEKQSDAGQSKDMDTAIDEDVNDVLAGLDGQPPPSKRVKQERREARESQPPQFSILTANGDQAPSSVQERIRVKREAGLSSLPSGISMQKVAEPAPQVPASVADYTPPPGITLTRPGQAPAPAPASPNIASRSSLTAQASVTPQPSPVSAPGADHIARLPLHHPRSTSAISPMNVPRPAVPPPSKTAATSMRQIGSPGAGIRPGQPLPPGARPLMSQVRPGLQGARLPSPQQPQLRGQAPDHPVLHIPDSSFSFAPGGGAGAGLPLALLGSAPSAGPRPMMFGSPGQGSAMPESLMRGLVTTRSTMSQQQQLMVAQLQHQQLQQPVQLQQQQLQQPQQPQQPQQQQLQQLQRVGTATTPVETASAGGNRTIHVNESDTHCTPTPQPISPQSQVDDLIEKAGSKLACKECKKTYSSKSKAQLVSHIESQHLELDVKCELCDKKFKATSYLKQHQKKGGCEPLSK